MSIPAGVEVSLKVERLSLLDKTKGLEIQFDRDGVLALVVGVLFNLDCSPNRVDELGIKECSIRSIRTFGSEDERGSTELKVKILITISSLEERFDAAVGVHWTVMSRYHPYELRGANLVE